VSTPAQGEIWWAQAEDQRRPVLVITRTEAIAVLGAIVVAPVTRTVRSIPSEVGLGPAEGLAVDCAASFDNLQPIRTSMLTHLVGSLGTRSGEICRALRAMSDC
jgi:mRNA interferase MazF